MLKQPSTLTGFVACWIQFVSILLRVYVSVFLRYWFVIFFSCNVFVWFSYWIILSSNNELGNILFLCSEKGSRELGYFFCKCWEEFTQGIHLGLVLSVLEGFNYEFNFFNRNIQIISKLSRLYLLRNWSISSRLSNLWAQSNS